MIKQKTILIGTTTSLNSGICLTFNEIQRIVNETADRLLEELDSLGHAFISLQISHMPEVKTHLDRIFVTIVYREVPTRKVLIEKANG